MKGVLGSVGRITSVMSGLRLVSKKAEKKAYRLV